MNVTQDVGFESGNGNITISLRELIIGGEKELIRVDTGNITTGKANTLNISYAIDARSSSRQLFIAKDGPSNMIAGNGVMNILQIR